MWHSWQGKNESKVKLTGIRLERISSVGAPPKNMRLIPFTPVAPPSDVFVSINLSSTVKKPKINNRTK